MDSGDVFVELFQRVAARPNPFNCTAQKEARIFMRAFSSSRGLLRDSRSGLCRPVFPSKKEDGGQGWVRTSVGVSQKIYSLPPLTARAPTHPLSFRKGRVLWAVEKALQPRFAFRFHLLFWDGG